MKHTKRENATHTSMRSYYMFMFISSYVLVKVQSSETVNSPPSYIYVIYIHIENERFTYTYRYMSLGMHALDVTLFVAKRLPHIEYHYRCFEICFRCWVHHLVFEALFTFFLKSVSQSRRHISF